MNRRRHQDDRKPVGVFLTGAFLSPHISFPGSVNFMSTIPIQSSSVGQPTAKLQPKEHGAYAILGIPIVTALAVTGPTVVGACVAAASVAGFLAHEPLLVALGHRGSRAQRITPVATKRLYSLLALMVVCGLIALAVGSTNVRMSLLGCGVLAIASFSLAVAGKHKSLGGQLWGVISLSVPCVPILLAGGVGTALTVEAWGTWLIGFSATTMAVRAVIAAQKRQSRILHSAAIVTLSLLVAALTSAAIKLPIAALPMLLMSWYLIIDPPHARQLKRIGWALAGGTTASAGWMIFMLH